MWRKKMYFSIALFWLFVALVGAFGVLFSKTPNELYASLFVSALALIGAKDSTNAYESLI